MALNKTQLRDAIKTAFQTANAAATKQPPDDPDATLDTLCLDLSNAIDTFVRGSDVVKVEVGIEATGGTYKQTNKGKIE
jgi:hypothetical protein